MTPELEVALVTFAAVIAAQLSKAGLRMLQSFVKGTKTNLDDKILAAVTGALKSTVVRTFETKESVPHDTVEGGKFYPKGSLRDRK